MRKSSTRLFDSLALTIVLSLLLSPFSSLVVAPTTVKALGEIEIDTCEELQLIGNDIAYPLDEDYILTQNIDCSLTNPATLGFDAEGTWGDETGFNPIGTDIDPFTGTFNGQGFAIDALFINKPLDDLVGLFSYLRGSVSNLGITNTDIIANNFVGGLSGFFASLQGSTVSNMYSTGEVVGDRYIGGLVGANGIGTISNSYSRSSVSGDLDVGGLVGENRQDGIIDKSYSTQPIAGNQNVGGLVGLNSGLVTNSFWDGESSGNVVGGGATSKTTEEMQDVNTFTDTEGEGLDSAWDFNANINYDGLNLDIWQLNEGVNNGYPFLLFNIPGEIEIDTCEELQLIGQDADYLISGEYLLADNIDCSLTNPATLGFDAEGTWGDEAGFEPIGSLVNPFTGTFNGQDFTISSLYIQRPDTDNVALFGLLNNANIYNLILAQVNIEGEDRVGGVIGSSLGTSVLDKISVSSGEINGVNSIGGVVGNIGGNSSLTDSSAVATLNGNQYVGGLAGYNTGLIETSYANSIIESSTFASGGFAGANDGQGSIENSYASGSVSGQNMLSCRIPVTFMRLGCKEL